MKEYYGNYLGICVYNCDPEYRGRVKVFVPHIMPTLYEHWNSEGKDITVSNIGTNLQDSLDDSAARLLESMLPWCEAATPIIGSSTAGARDNTSREWMTKAMDFLNPYAGIPSSVNGLSATDTTQQPDKSSQGILPGKRPFLSPGEGANTIHTTTDYGPEPVDFTHMAEGMFSVPNVGAFLWVFFQNGNPLFPVYFAASYGKNEWASAYQANPGEAPLYYPNAVDGSTTPNNGQKAYYANSTVMRPNGAGALIFNDSAGRDIGDQRSIKLAAHTGAHLAFQSNHAVLYSPDDLYQQTDSNLFDAAIGNRETFTNGDSNIVTVGDHIIKIGNVEASAAAAAQTASDLIKQANDIMLTNVPQIT
jgi:hypothetical protein